MVRYWELISLEISTKLQTKLTSKIWAYLEDSCENKTKLYIPNIFLCELKLPAINFTLTGIKCHIKS
jgi:hypothetical protein